MRYAVIDNCECVNGLGWGVTLYIQGCPHHCKGCFNPETWDFDGGSAYTYEQTQEIIQIYKDRPEYTHFVIEGGEPLERKNWDELLKLVLRIKQELPHLKIWLYTGYNFEYLYDMCDLIEHAKHSLYPLLENIDILIDGIYIQEQKDLTLKFRGSKNQRLIDCKKSLLDRKPILADI